jgi:RHS repeat-associated protein
VVGRQLVESVVDSEQFVFGSLDANLNTQMKPTLTSIILAVTGFAIFLTQAQVPNTNNTASSGAASASQTNHSAAVPISESLANRLTSDGVAARLLSGPTTNQAAVDSMRAAYAAARAAYMQAHPPASSLGHLQMEGSSAIGQDAPHQLSINAANIHTSGSVDITMPDGQHIRSQPLALGYYIPGGTNILIASIKNRAGEIVGQNEILFQDAFDNVKADVSYTYTGSSVNQSIIIRKSPPSPADYGLQDENQALIVVLSEIIDSPAPRVLLNPIDLTPFNHAAGVEGDNTLYDENILFPNMSIGNGKSFVLGDATTEIPTGKSWIYSGNRLFLAESTPYRLLKGYLSALPPGTAMVNPLNGAPPAINPLLRGLPPATPVPGTSNSAGVQASAKSMRSTGLMGLVGSLPQLAANTGSAALISPSDSLPPSSAPNSLSSQLQFFSETVAPDEFIAFDPTIAPLMEGLKMPERNSMEAGVVLDYTVSSQLLYNIDFGRQNGDEIGFAATGHTTNDYWNGFAFPGSTSSTIYSILDSGQNGTSINVTVSNAPGLWGNSTGDPMYDRFIYPWNSGSSVTVLVDNLLAGSYNLYCYGHSQLHEDNSFFTATVGTNTSLTLGTQDSTLAATSANWQLGVQYVILTNVPVSSGQELSLTVAPGDGNAILNGLQIASSSATYSNGPPLLTVPPASQCVPWGTASVTFNVAINADAPYGYQWLFNTNAIAGATNASLTLINVQPSQAGTYSVVVTNAYGSITGSACLTVLEPGCKLLNLNFGATNTAKTGFAVVGLGASDFWNGYQYTGQTNVSVTNLLWSDQSSSGVNMSVQNAAGYGTNSTGDPMFDAFVYPQNTNSMTVTFTNLPTGTYSFYCYGHGPNPWDDAQFHVTSGSYTSASEKTRDAALAGASDVWEENWQYVVLRNVPVTNGTPVTITAAPSDGTAILNGIQVLMPAPLCYAALDMALVVDRSWSMTDTSPIDNLNFAQDACSNLIQNLNFTYDNAALLTWDNMVATNATLTNDLYTISNAVASMTGTNGANADTALAISNAQFELTNPARLHWGQPVMVLMSEGLTNGGFPITGQTNAITTAANYAKSQGTRFIALAIGKDAFSNFFMTLPATTNDYYFASTNAQSQLTNVFSSLSSKLCRPSPPTVAITAPPNSAQLTSGTNLLITANAAATPGLILKQVQFFQGTNSLGIVTASPYQVTWSSVPTGSYTLTAVATDALGASTTSSGVIITVYNHPTVTITNPLSGAQFSSGANISISATAAAASGLTITKVQFFKASTLLGTVTAAPYNFTWNNATTGSWTLTAKATDSAGGVTTSSGVTITVYALPSVSITNPVNNSQFSVDVSIILKATASAASGLTITNVQFFQGSTSLGSVASAPYNLTWPNIPTGSYSLTAKASDSLGGVKTSAAINITVHPPPAIQVTNPTNEASFAYGTVIPMAATATADTGLTISSVKFYNRGNLIVAGNLSGTANSYTNSWTNAPSGVNLLNATATDSVGATTTSSNINVIVACPEPAPTNVTLNPSSVVGGNSASGVVTLSSTAPASGQVVILASDTNVVAPDASVFVASGQSNATFSIQSFMVSVPTTAHISATYHGQTVSNSMTLNPPPTNNIPAGTNGFTYSLFASNFPGDIYSSTHPLSAVQNEFGQVLVTTYQRNLFIFPSDQDGQDATATNVLSIAPMADGTNAYFYGMARVGNKTYVNYKNLKIGSASGGVAELRNDGTITNEIVISGVDQPIGLAANPQTGLLYVTDNSSGNLYVVDPVAGTWTILLTSVYFDGISVSLDGHTAYVAAGLDQVLGYDLSSGANVFSVQLPSSPDAGPDGIGVGQGTLAGQLFVNCNDGELIEVNLTSGSYTSLVPNQLGRGDFVSLDSNGSLLLAESYLNNSPFTNSWMLRLTPPAGASFGPVSSIIATRDDIHETNTPIALSSPNTLAVSNDIDQFDLRGVFGGLAAVQFTRAGTIAYTNSSAVFDFEYGVQSLTTNTNVLSKTSYAAPASYPLPAPGSYSATWPLSTDFMPDLQARLGAIYQVAMADRVSSICQTNSFTDNPQTNWPTARNRLLCVVEGDTNPQIPQGRALDLTTTGSIAPTNGSWEIVLNHAIIASSGNPNGWNVEDDHNFAPFHGAFVTVPAGVAAALGYEVHVAAPSRSGFFDVVSPGSAPFPAARAPVLLPLVISQGFDTNGGSDGVTISLDAPAPDGGATVVFSSDNPLASFETNWLTIPAGATTTNVTVSIASGALPGTANLTASFNGLRQVALGIITNVPALPGAPNVTASNNASGITLNWTNVVPSALSYNVKRARVHNGPYTTIFSELATTNFEDTAIFPGLTYYYVVSGVNDAGEGSNSSEVSTNFVIGQVATPVASPAGSPATAPLTVLLSDSTPSSFIHYTFDGSDPTEGSPVYRTPFTLLVTNTLRAKAFKAGWIPSVTATNVYQLSPSINPVGISCGDVLMNDVGFDPNQTINYSIHKPNGQVYFARYFNLYLFAPLTNVNMTITMTSDTIDSYLYLLDGSYNVLAYSSNAVPGNPNARLFYPAGNIITDTQYYIEATTATPGQQGNFTILMDCGKATPTNAAIGVDFSGTTSFLATDGTTNGLANFGTNYVGQLSQGILSITNSGIGGLDIRSLRASGDFVVTPVLLPGIANGASSNLLVMLPGAAQGNHTGTIVISNNTTNLPNPITISLSAYTAGVGAPPTVSISSDSSTYTPGQTVNITATPIPSNATIARVDFYDIYQGATNHINEMTQPSTGGWLFPWSAEPAGVNVLMATTTDSRGRLSSFSPSVTNVMGTITQTLANPTIATNGGFVTTTNGGIFKNSVLVSFTNLSDTTETVLFTTDTNASPNWYIYQQQPIVLTPTTGQNGTNLLQVRAIETGWLPSGTNTALIIVTNGAAGSTNLPVAAITSPSDGDVITCVTNIMGVANLATPDPGAFESWQLAYRPSGNSNGTWAQFASDTSASGTSQSPGTFVPGQFDPTLLLNGLYDILLTVSDTNGDTTNAIITVSVQGKQKVGVFTLSFTDLTVPVAGIPIQITRTYDSRDKGQGDFGTGWRLALSGVSVQKNGTLGSGWEQDSYGGLYDSTFEVQPTQSHMVSITFPGDQTYSFEAALNPSSQGYAPIPRGNVIFQPLPGTYATLSPTGDTSVDDLPTSGRFTLQGQSGVYDASEFNLRLNDGRVFLVSVNAGLESMTDLNGHIISFATNGILIANAATPTQRTNIVTFQRNSQNLITNIYITAAGSNNTFKYIYGASNQSPLDLSLVIDQAGNTNTFYYDAQDDLTDIIAPNGAHVTKNVYGSDGRLHSATDALGHTTRYDYSNIQWNTVSITDPLDHVTTITYDALGNVITKTQTVNGVSLVTTSQFNDQSNPNKPTMIVDPLGRTNQMTYYPSGDLFTSVDALNNQTQYAYNAYGNSASITDPRGVSIVLHSYDSNGNLTNSINAIGAQISQTYTTDGNLASTTDAYGHTIRYSYGDTVTDPNTGSPIVADPAGTGQATTIIDALGHTNNSIYDYAGNRVRMFVTQTISGTLRTNDTVYAYDSNGNLTNTIVNGQIESSAQYNSMGKTAASYDALGRATTFTYDELGRVIQIILPDNHTNSIVYDEIGNTYETINQLGYVTRHVYDNLGRQVATIRPDGSLTTNELDNAGQLIASHDANGNVTRYVYDAGGHLYQAIDALGRARIYYYDQCGRRTSIVDANTNVTQYAYDDAGHLTNVVFPDGTILVAQYDVVGRKIAETDQAANTTCFGYDASGRLISVTNSLGKVTTYGYDEVGNETNQIDGLMREIKFEYDAFGRRTKRTLPGLQFETFGYDGVGNPVAHTNFDGLITTNAFDSMKRLQSRWSGATQLESYAYDSEGQLTNRIDSSGSYAWIYDRIGRIITNSSPAGTLIYGYDANGNQTNLFSVTPNGVSIAYQYDALNRITNVIDNRLSGLGTVTYAFDSVGNQISLSYPNGAKATYQYDSLSHLTNLQWQLNANTLATFAYLLDSTGHRTNLNETVCGASRGYVWTSDKLYRVTNETISGAAPTGSIFYGFDDVGNRTNRGSTVAGINGQTLTYGTNDWLSTDNYDKDGNTTNSSGVPYLYDYANRLTNSGNGAVILTYGADGNLIKKITPSGTNLYLVATVNPTGYPQVVEELLVAGTTNLSKTYTYGSALINQRKPGTATNFFVADGHGSTRVLLDSGTNVVNTLAYEAYGTLIASNATTQTSYLYCGEQWDADLKMSYRRARWLNQNSGRFWTMDLFEGKRENPFSLHKYLYASCDPVNRIDPSGNDDLVELLATTAIRSGLGALVSAALKPAGGYIAAALIPKSARNTLAYDGAPDAIMLGISGSLSVGFGQFPGGVTGGAGLELLGSPKTFNLALYGYAGGGVTFGATSDSPSVQGTVGLVFRTRDSQVYRGPFVTMSMPYKYLSPIITKKIDAFLASGMMADVWTHKDVAGGGPELAAEAKSLGLILSEIINRSSVNVFFDPTLENTVGISFSVSADIPLETSSTSNPSVTYTKYWQLLPMGNENVPFR